jgi:hypothetical protein
MRFEDFLDTAYESETDRLLDEMYKEDPELDEYVEPDFNEDELFEQIG